jgi:flagellar basal body-associated protein FliL
MDNQTNSNQNCGCGDGCCTPPQKSSIWKIIIFVVIIVAAGAIITLKLIRKDDATPAECCPQTEEVSCCPQSEK